MTATIIAFPVPGTGGSRGPARDVALPPAPAVLLPLPGSDRATAPLPVAAQHAVLPIPGAAGTAGAQAASRGAPYLGPCRRVRGLRSMAAARAVGVQTVSEAPDRLARALDGLQAALAQQARVLAGWRASLAELEGAVCSLQNGVARQAGAVGVLGTRVSEPGGGTGSVAGPEAR